MKRYWRVCQTIIQRPFFLEPSLTILPDSTRLWRFLMTVERESPATPMIEVIDAFLSVETIFKTLLSVAFKVSFIVSFIVSFKVHFHYHFCDHLKLYFLFPWDRPHHSDQNQTPFGRDWSWNLINAPRKRGASFFFFFGAKFDWCFFKNIIVF